MNTITRFIILLTIPTGFAGLLYEVVWHRYLSNLLGSQARASAIILAVFLGGLSIGYFLCGKISNRISRRGCILGVVLIEFFIGIYGYFSPELVNIYGDLLRNSSLITEIGVSCLLLLPPTIAMGGTLPFFTQALSPNTDSASLIHSRLYAANTAGGFLGSIITGLFLLPTFGLKGSILFGVLGNIIPAILLLISLRYIPNDNPKPKKSESQENISIFKNLDIFRFHLVAFLAGFIALTFQVVLIRMVGLSFGASEYSFALVVSLFILYLAIGALLLNERSLPTLSISKNQSVVFVGLLIIYLLAPYCTYSAYLLRSSIGAYVNNFHLYLLILFCMLSLIVALPIGSMGRTLPLLFSSTKDSAADLGKTVGSLYGVNTLGCVLGALVGGYLLFFDFNIDSIFRGILIITALTIILSKKSGAYSLSNTLLIFILIALPPLLPSWDKRYFATGLFRHRSMIDGKRLPYAPFYSLKKDRELLFYDDGPNTTVSVVKSGDDVLSLWVNGKSDGATDGGDLITTRLLAHLPSLFTDKVESAAVIGFGTGITSGSLTLHEKINTVHSIEIANAVRDAAPLFSPFNNQVLTSDKHSWILSDAFQHFRTSHERYDIISSEPSNPWMTGIERLYTPEFYDLALKRLSPNGVFAQWLQLYALSDEVIEIVLRNITSSFPHTRIFILQNDSIIIGSREPLKMSDLEERFNGLNEEIRKELKEIGVHEWYDLLAHSYPLPRDMFRERALHTLEHPRLAYLAGEAFFYGERVPIISLFNSQRYPEWRDSIFRTLRDDFNLLADKTLINGAYQTFLGKHCRGDHDKNSDPILCKLFILQSVLINGEINSWLETLKPDEKNGISFVLGIPIDSTTLPPERLKKYLENYGAILSEEVYQERLNSLKVGS